MLLEAFLLHLNGLCDFVVCSDACQSALARTVQSTPHGVRNQVPSSGLGDGMKYGTVSPISIPRQATWIEAICHCKSSNSAVVFDSY